MTTKEPSDEHFLSIARSLLNREYGKDHPSARHDFTITFATTSRVHQEREVATLLREQYESGRAFEREHGQSSRPTCKITNERIERLKRCFSPRMVMTDEECMALLDAAAAPCWLLIQEE